MTSSKLYEVTDIDFWYLTIEARECDLNISDVPEEEAFCLEDFGEFKVTLRNRGGIVDFGDWIKGHGKS